MIKEYNFEDCQADDGEAIVLNWFCKNLNCKYSYRTISKYFESLDECNNTQLLECDWSKECPKVKNPFFKGAQND